MNDQIEIVIIYGELFGGLYSHKDKKYLPKPGIKHVQKGVYYSPALHFYAFDIRTNYFEDDDEKDSSNKPKKKQKSVKLEFGKSLEIFKKSGFLYCEPLKIGTFDECISFDVEKFESTIPSKLGLPPPTDPQNDTPIKNIAEGIVLRKLYGRHASIKIKAKAFYEVTGHQLPGTKPKKQKNWGNINKKMNNKQNKESIKQNGMDKYNLNEELFDFIERCVNENRYESVCSKEGELSLENCRKIKGMMTGDVWKELNTQKFGEINGLNKDAQKVLKQYAQSCVQEFFLPKLLNLKE